MRQSILETETLCPQCCTPCDSFRTGNTIYERLDCGSRAWVKREIPRPTSTRPSIDGYSMMQDTRASFRSYDSDTAVDGALDTGLRQDMVPPTGDRRSGSANEIAEHEGRLRTFLDLIWDEDEDQPLEKPFAPPINLLKSLQPFTSIPNRKVSPRDKAQEMPSAMAARSPPSSTRFATPDAAKSGDFKPLPAVHHKVVLCRNYGTPAGCRFGKFCTFAHGVEDLHQSAPPAGPVTKHSEEKYKTTMCLHWRNGHCTWGDKCNFAHGTTEIRAREERSQSPVDHVSTHNSTFMSPAAPRGASCSEHVQQDSIFPQSWITTPNLPAGLI